MIFVVGGDGEWKGGVRLGNVDEEERFGVGIVLMR